MFKMLLARAREVRAGELEGESGLEGGFTLIELMVVLLIIAILLAIAIPTFLSVSGGARDRAAQSDATNSLTDAIAYYQNGQTYDATANNTACSQNLGTGCTGDTTLATAMDSAEPSFNWYPGTVAADACGLTAQGGTSGEGKCVSVAPYDTTSTGNDGNATVLAVLSGTGTCWFIANLQANPSYAGTFPSTGFETTATSASAGYESSGGSEISAAGTYYSQLQSAGSNCYAGYAITYSGGWSWGSNYAGAPNK